jgi:competence protein ComEC
VDFEFLSPLRAGDWRSDNDSSSVLRVTARGRTVLLTGDIERRREEWLVRRARIPRADLVVAPHHGSRSSSSPLLVAATRPRWVVFATGYRNRWRFPAAEVQARWRGVDACLLDTAATGALRFTLDRIGRFDLAAAARSDDAQLWTAQGPPQACPDGPTP